MSSPREAGSRKGCTVRLAGSPHPLAPATLAASSSPNSASPTHRPKQCPHVKHHSCRSSHCCPLPTPPGRAGAYRLGPAPQPGWSPAASVPGPAWPPCCPPAGQPGPGPLRPVDTAPRQPTAPAGWGDEWERVGAWGGALGLSGVTVGGVGPTDRACRRGLCRGGVSGGGCRGPAWLSSCSTSCPRLALCRSSVPSCCSDSWRAPGGPRSWP